MTHWFKFKKINNIKLKFYIRDNIVNLNLIDSKSKSILIFSNSAMILTILVHDADHIRQAYNCGFIIPAMLWLVNILVYLPNLYALKLSFQRKANAAQVTAIGSLSIAFLFAKVHLWKPFFPIWGMWNKTFFELNADAISWTILALTVLMGVFAAMASCWVMGRQSLQH